MDLEDVRIHPDWFGQDVTADTDVSAHKVAKAVVQLVQLLQARTAVYLPKGIVVH